MFLLLGYGTPGMCQEMKYQLLYHTILNRINIIVILQVISHWWHESEDFFRIILSPLLIYVTIVASMISTTIVIGNYSIFVAVFNSLWASDAIRWHRTGSTLAQVIPCCLTTPCHHLSQCWLIINKVHFHSSSGNFTRDTTTNNPKD